MSSAPGTVASNLRAQTTRTGRFIMETNEIPTKSEIKQAVSLAASILRSICDGAHEQDGMGYNSTDQWIRNKSYSTESDADVERVRRALLKYKRQLPANLYETIQHEYAKMEVATDESGRKRGIVLRVANGRLVAETPYKASFVAAIRSIPSRRYDGRTKANTFALADAEAVKAVIKEHYGVEVEVEIPVGADAVEAPVEEQPDGRVFVDGDYVIVKTAAFIPELYEICKFAGRGVWFAERKAWGIPVNTPERIEAIKKIVESNHNLVFDKAEIDAIFRSAEERVEAARKQAEEDAQKQAEIREMSAQSSIDADDMAQIKTPTGLALYPYQAAGVRFIEHVRNTLIGDEMGLGKTIQVLAYAYNHPDVRPIVVVVPAAVKINWKREIGKWCPEDRVCVLTGRDGNIDQNCTFFIVNYDILPYRLEQLKAIGCKIMVADEAHYVKNPKSNRSKAVYKLSESVEQNILLTGTPILNRPRELLHMLQVLHVEGDEMLTNPKKFLWRYCDPQYNGHGYTYDGASNLDELQEKLRSHVMIRRMKKDVLKDLPPKRRIYVPMEIDNRSEYQEAEDDFVRWYYENGGEADLENGEALVRIEKLRQLAYKGKIDNMISFITDMAENVGRAVVFVHHRDLHSKIVKALSKEHSVVSVIGGQGAEKNQDMVDEFNSGRANIAVCSIKAAGVGLNMQTASVAIFCEQAWTPADLRQAEDRIHRNGQISECEMYYLTAEGTIEDYIQELVEAKQKIAEEALDLVSTIANKDDEKTVKFEVIRNLIRARGGVITAPPTPTTPEAEPRVIEASIPRKHATGRKMPQVVTKKRTVRLTEKKQLMGNRMGKGNSHPVKNISAA